MIKQQLRPYQLEPARAILESVLNRKGHTFSVEIARQGGKNELSAQLEVLLLTLHLAKGGNAIKCSPTFKPQTVNSLLRLKERLTDAGYDGLWKPEMGYMVRLGKARAVFFSADKSANVVGATAHILLEVDESQDVEPDKYNKDFRPMGSTTNCTTVHYGTACLGATLTELTRKPPMNADRHHNRSGACPTERALLRISTSPTLWWLHGRGSGRLARQNLGVRSVDKPVLEHALIAGPPVGRVKGSRTARRVDIRIDHLGR